jgi:hypothetical protein
MEPAELGQRLGPELAYAAEFDLIGGSWGEISQPD